MRTGKLKIKQYKTRRSGRGILLFLALIICAGAAVLYLYQKGDLPLPLPPSPTLSPEETKAEERILSLPAQTWYTLQLGVFEQESSAKALAENFQGRGAAGFIYRKESYRVLAAAYESRADAQAVQNQLKAQHGVEAYLMELISPEISLRLTGQKAQLTALSDAYDALNQTAQHLSQLSISLDQRTASDEDIRAALQSRKETIAALESRIRQLFGASPHRAVQPVIDALQQLSRALDTALAAQGSTRLGAGIKYCQLSCITGLIDYAALLAN